MRMSLLAWNNEFFNLIENLQRNEGKKSRFQEPPCNKWQTRKTLIIAGLHIWTKK